jgi:hypothetical protein
MHLDRRCPALGDGALGAVLGEPLGPALGDAPGAPVGSWVRHLRRRSRSSAGEALGTLGAERLLGELTGQYWRCRNGKKRCTWTNAGPTLESIGMALGALLGAELLLGELLG